MRSDEQASLIAINHWAACMKPVVLKAKLKSKLSDRQVRSLGYACRSELRRAAERLAERSDLESVAAETKYQNMTRPEQIAYHENDLAAVYWCAFRPCYSM